MNNFLKMFCLAGLATTVLLMGCGDGSAKNESRSNAAQEVQAKKFPSFSAKDVNGRDVTEKIFSDKKITVVNIWGTFCPPCIGEMPELGEWAKNMPPEVQLIGIVCDVKNENDTKTINAAKKILSEANADFVNIVPNVELIKFMESVDAVPTTIFVDAEGNLIGQPIVGADVEGYKKFVEEHLK